MPGFFRRGDYALLLNRSEFVGDSKLAGKIFLNAMSIKRGLEIRNQADGQLSV